MILKNMNDVSNIEAVVMRRVKRIRVLRAVFSGTTLAALVFVAALWGIGREVWVAKVFENGPQTFVGHAFYLVYAFEHTRFVVQALTLATVGALVYLARDTAKFVTHIGGLRTA